jgi:hypothetical protein
MAHLNIYQRPISAVPPYVVENCALWMVKNRQSANLESARVKLAWLSGADVNRYRYILSAYLESQQPPKSDIYKFNQNVQSYKTSCLPYGEPHMFYKRPGV